MADAHKNFAYSTILTAPSPAASGTSLVVQSGDGTKFPAVPFNAQVWPAGAQPLTSNAEIVRVTGIATDTFTITRTQEGTSARSIVAGDQVAAGITALTLTDAEDIRQLTGDVTAGPGGGSQAATIPAGTVTYAKMQDVSATDKLLGRSTAGAGDVEEIACTAAGRAILDDADASAQLVTLGAAVKATSSTDNAVARFDGTGGAALQNSAATISDDGIIRSATNSGANPVSVPLVNWLMLTANYTLANSAAEQKVFDTTTNGTLTLPTGVYFFKVFLYVTAMGVTSGNLSFDPIGAGTAITDRWGQHCTGNDANSPLAAGTQTGSASVTQQFPTSMVVPGTGTGMIAEVTGMFRISTGGTIIPSVTLVTAIANCLVMAGSWFMVEKIGESSETFVGAWS